jgi:RND family efflux transporter MFP subunit
MKDIQKDSGRTETTPGSLNGHEGANIASGNGLARPLSSTELASMRPRRGRLPLVLSAALVLLLGLGAIWWFLLRPGPAANTATVRRDTIVSTVETTGKLEAQSSARLSFKVPGRVANVFAEAGDRVEAGDVLAELDVENLERQLAEARTQLEISRLKLQQAREGARPEDVQAASADLNAATARLNNVRSGSRSEDIAAAQAVLNQAQAKLDQLRKGTPAEDIAQGEAALRQAQAKLEQVKAPASPDQIARAEAAMREAQAKHDALAAGPTEQDLAAAQAAVDQAQANLDKVRAGASEQDIAASQAVVEQATASRTQIASTAANAKEQARLAVVQASNALQNAQDVYGKIKYDNSQVDPDDLTDEDRNRESKALRDVQDSEARVQQAVLDYEAAKQTEIAQLAAADAKVREAQAALDKLNAGPTVEDITAAQAGVDQANAKLDALNATPRAEDLAAAQAGVDQANSALADLRAGGTPAAVAAAQADVDKSQAALDSLRAGTTSEEIRVAEEEVKQSRAALDKARAGATLDEIREVEAGVAAAQAALDKANAGATGTDVAILEQQIALAQLAVNRAESQVGDAKLVSPLSGTLLNIDIDAGENVNGQQAVATVADVDELRVKADVDEIDVGRVTAGQPVTVTLDAYPGVKMAGTIESIDPGATQKQGSTVFRATISLVPARDVVPREGMAANVDITAQRKDGVLLLPNRAFETIGTRQYVTLAAQGNPKIEVETGLTNNTDTEVISGLEEGQVVRIK